MTLLERVLRWVIILAGAVDDRGAYADRAVRELVLSGGGAYDEGQVTEWAFDQVGQDEAVASVTDGLVDAYMRDIFGDDAVGEEQVAPVPVPRRGVDPVEVWSRPVKEYRRLVAEGKPQEEALDRAAMRAQVMGEWNAQGLVRDTVARAATSVQDVVGYRRVLRPEASQSGPCGLCYVAATRLYRVSEVAPLHGRCKCGFAPVTEDFDPGLELNRDDLEALYRAAGSTDSADLKRLRVTFTGGDYAIDDDGAVVVRGHAELGPVLAWRDHAWRTKEG